MFTLLIFQVIVGAAAKAFPRVCLDFPRLSLVAGTPATFRWDPFISYIDLTTSGSIQNPLNSICEALLDFDNDQFLPVSFLFAPIQCAGTQVAGFNVPIEVPSGDVRLSL